jgi:glycine/D-amino acid oxidase-like deaminating enzyme
MPNASVPRVAVIGAGIIGAAIANRLAGRGIEVVVLDRGNPAEGTTAASYALVSARTAADRAAFDLLTGGMQEMHRLAWGLAPAGWYHATGALVWYRDAERAAALAADVRRLRSWGYAAEMLADRHAADIPSGLPLPTDTAVAWFAGDAWVDAPAMTARLIKAVRHAGGRVLTGAEREVVAIGCPEGHVRDVTLRGGQTIDVAAVVNAAGPDVGRVAALVGRTLALHPGSGLVLRVAVPPATRVPSVPVLTDGILVRPDGLGRMLLKSNEIDARLGDTPPGPFPIDNPLTVELLARGVEAFPALAAATPLAARVGALTDPVGRFTSVGPVPAIPGYWEAVTDWGVALAPLIGRVLAEEILGGEVNPLLEPFRADAAIS